MIRLIARIRFYKISLERNSDTCALSWNRLAGRYNLQGPGTYAFGYDVADEATGNTHFREEQRHPNGTVTGSYGWVDPQGRVTVVSYVADKNGYR